MNQRKRLRHGIGAVAILSITAMLGACTQGSSYHPPTANWRFKATHVTVVNTNDCDVFCDLFGTPADEPYPVIIQLHAKTGTVNSASRSVNRGAEHSPLQDGQGAVLPANEQAPVQYGGVQMLDVADLLLGFQKMDLVIYWAWAAESDLDAFNSIQNAAEDVADIMVGVLNTTLNTLTLGTDPNAIAGKIFDVLFNNIGSLFALAATNLFNLLSFGLADDPIGSRIYIGLGAGGTLGATINSVISGALAPTVPAINIPGVAIPVVNDPPDIQGGEMFALGNRNFTGQTLSTESGYCGTFSPQECGTHVYDYNLSAY